MTVVARPNPVRRSEPVPWWTHRPVAKTEHVVSGALFGATLGLTYLVAEDGSLPWRVARAVGVAGLGAMTINLMRRPGRRGARGVVAVIAGAIALAVGIGIAVPHLTKDGTTATALAGIVVLVGGAALIAVGGAWVVRATSRWWRLVSIPAVVLTVAIALYTLGQAVAATNVPDIALGASTPRDVGLAYRDVEFESSDGVALSGWYVPSSSGAAVVLLHGAGSTRSNVLDHAAVLARHGYGVLLFDARGHGRSGGRAMDFGWWGDEDIGGAVTFLESQPDVDNERIAAVGMSMGAEEAIGASATDARIRAVVAEGAGQRMAADKQWQSKEMGARGWLQEQIDALEFWLTDLFTSADPPTPLRTAVAQSAPRPVLLIAGGAEAEEDVKARYIASGSPETVDLWIVPEAGHTAGLETVPQEWEDRVVLFLASAMAS